MSQHHADRYHDACEQVDDLRDREAVEGPQKYLYRLIRRQRELHAEVICARHYAIESQPGRSMAPVSDREKAQGVEQTLTPFVGERDCEMCQDEAETNGSAA